MSAACCRHGASASAAETVIVGADEDVRLDDTNSSTLSSR